MESDARTGNRQQGSVGPGRQDPKRIGAIVILVLAAAWLVAFIVANSEQVNVSFVFGDVSLSLIWVMIMCAALGALLAVGTPRLSRWRRGR